MSKWSDIKMYDLTIPIGICTPAWPTYEPLQMKFFKRLTPNGANGQLLTHSNHVGTHLDGPMHFDTAGRDIASLELTRLCRPGVVVDLSDQAEDFGIYTPQDIEKARDREGRRRADHQHRLPHLRLGQPESRRAPLYAAPSPVPRWTSSSGCAIRSSAGSAWTAAARITR